jgi:hypothetical protein
MKCRTNRAYEAQEFPELYSGFSGPRMRAQKGVPLHETQKKSISSAAYFGGRLYWQCDDEYGAEFWLFAILRQRLQQLHD